MGELDKVLKQISPNSKSEKKETVFVEAVMTGLRANLSAGKPVLAGSFAKGTFLEGDKDIDIFVLFSHQIHKEAMLPILRVAAEKTFSKAIIKSAYAQHPYLRIFLGKRKIDLVPAYEVGHGLHFELKSAVDRSQLHTEYILKRMNNEQKGEVRLLKKLLKLHGLYGAEIRVQGFSGYLCELLILRYGSLLEVITNAANWKGRAYIDVENLLLEDDAMGKFLTPLVVIDPVDKERNVSAVVSEKNYFAFISLARKFIKGKNRMQFFKERKFSDSELRKFIKNRNIVCFSFPTNNAVDDVLWGQIRRFA
ncbi:CCA tRNA nucleotidyltransferase [Candidatus Micrarchaeota archaeon]|nr:CCA tRNA nucleotidyltransferase [Candidatus Micrarchaeota archaeon]